VLKVHALRTELDAIEAEAVSEARDHPHQFKPNAN
jgi:hypothetical protein